MKKTQEILGLTIVDIHDGSDVGKVKDIIINAAESSIDFILVDSGVQIINSKVIPSNVILGIGKDALTIEDISVVCDIANVPDSISYLQKNVRIKDTKVLTKKGEMVGKIRDFYVDDENNLKIVALEFIGNNSNGDIKIMPIDSVITLGNNLIIVNQDFEERLCRDISELEGGLPEETPYENIFAEFDNSNQSLFIENDKPIKNLFAQNDKIPQNSKDESMSNLFEQKQRDYLKDRRATKSILSNSGEVIIENGEIITEEIIEMVKQSGKLIELVMNNKA